MSAGLVSQTILTGGHIHMGTEQKGWFSITDELKKLDDRKKAQPMVTGYINPDCLITIETNGRRTGCRISEQNSILVGTGSRNAKNMIKVRLVRPQTGWKKNKNWAIVLKCPSNETRVQVDSWMRVTPWK